MTQMSESLSENEIIRQHDAYHLSQDGIRAVVIVFDTPHSSGTLRMTFDRIRPDIAAMHLGQIIDHAAMEMARRGKTITGWRWHLVK